MVSATAVAKSILEANRHQGTFDLAINLPPEDMPRLIDAFKALGCTVEQVGRSKDVLYRVTAPTEARS